MPDKHNVIYRNGVVRIKLPMWNRYRLLIEAGSSRTNMRYRLCTIRRLPNHLVENIVVYLYGPP